MAPALACLRMTTPELQLRYPQDAHAHYVAVHQALTPWLQNSSKHASHKYGGYGGPWIENLWIQHFQPTADAATKLSHVFGPYIPLFIPWVD